VPRTLVTGATGFLGSHVVRALLERGDEVRITVRRGSTLTALRGLDVERVLADVTDPVAVARAVHGVDRVFHLAGLTSVRAGEEALLRSNAIGTRVVMQACLREGVERVVHTSAASALGPAARGSTADETQVARARELAHFPYAAAKASAEAEVFRAAAQGLPAVIVNPAFCFGPGDHLRSSTEVVRRFLLRRIPAYVDGAINVVDVRDVAAGHLAADERGEPGERYLLGDRNYTWERLFADLGRCSGVEPPAVRLPVAAAVALADTVRRSPVPVLRGIDASELRAAGHYWTYRSTKARRELGWSTRPHEETVETTVEWWRERLGERLNGSGRQPLGLRLAGASVRRAQDLAAQLAA
jgi:dihydroflavonol-4-reductase